MPSDPLPTSGRSPFNPFPGLRHFEFDETALFFGRDGQSDEVLRRLRTHRFLAVIGASGSGKSSLIRAGVLPAIYGGMMARAGSRWRHAIFRPGDDPIKHLSRALGKKDVLADENEQDDTLDTALIESTLRSSGLGLIEAVRVARLPPRENLLVIVDQFEELFRFATAARSMQREDDAAAFVKLLLEATGQTEVPIYVVITMRSDFIGDCARFRDLAESVNDGMYLIPRLTRDQRKEAISGPVAVGGAAIAPRLVNRLLNDVGDNPDQLPILQHALMRTWERWEQDRQPAEPLDLRHYEAIGGMAEALSRHAEEAYAELPDGRHREIAKRLFQSLTEKGGDNREVRRPTRIAEIVERARAEPAEVLTTVECFRRPGRSFLMPPSDVPLGEQSIVDISHESLIRGWHRLADWVQEESTSAEVYRRLAETAAYHAQGHAGFLANPELSVALSWRDREWPTAAWARRYPGDFDLAMRFLSESDRAHEAAEIEKERRRARDLRRLQVFAAVVLAAFLVATAFGVISLRQQRRLNERNALIERQKGEAQQRTAELQREAVELQKANGATADALKVANQKTTEAERQTKTADEQRASAEAEKKEAELSANLLHDELLASRKALVNDQGEITKLSDDLVSQSSKMFGVVGLIEKQESFSETGDHRASIEQLDKILQIQLDNLPALASRGYEYLLVGQPAKAIVDLKKYLEADPRSSNSFENLSIAQAMVRDYAAARQSTQKAIETYSPTVNDGMLETELSSDVEEATGHKMLRAPGHAYLVALYYELAAIDAMSGDPRFVADLKQADDKARQYPRSPDPYQVVLDWAWLETRQFADYGVSAFFGAMWERLAETNPRFRRWAFEQYSKFQKDDATLRDPRYRQLAAWVRGRLAGLPAPAREGAPKVDLVALRAQAEELQERIGYDSKDLMQLSSVKAILDQAIELARDPSQKAMQRDTLVELLAERVKVENDANDIPALRRDCEEILTLDPRNANAEYYLAVHDTDDASKRRHFQNALADSPLDPLVLRDYSEYLLAKKDAASRAEALKLIATRIRLEPYSTSAYFDMAKLQHLLHHDTKALESIDALLAIEPEVDRYYEQRRDIEASIAERKKTADLHLVSGYLTAANALLFLDRPEEALAQYLHALNAAAALPDQSNEDVRFQSELAARSITSFLIDRSTAADASQFWKFTAASTKNPNVAQWANEELNRLKNR